MFLKRVKPVHWPRAILAQGIGHVVMALYRFGYSKTATKMAKIPHWLWKGIPL